MESTGVQRIPDRWRGEPVEVGHYVQQSGVLSVGSSAGTLEHPRRNGRYGRTPLRAKLRG